MSWTESEHTKYQGVFQKLTPGIEYHEGGSRFLAYSMSTRSVDDINEAYLSVRMAHIGARHIVCAFSLPGRKMAQMNDFEDDEEWGCGRILLAALQHMEIEYKCLFAVRYYNGKQIGSIRFTKYLLAARSALVHDAINPIINKYQTPWTEEYAEYYTPKQGEERGNRGWRGRGQGWQLYRRGRGRGGGRGGYSNSYNWADQETEDSQTSGADGDGDTDYDSDGFPIGEQTYAERTTEVD